MLGALGACWRAASRPTPPVLNCSCARSLFGLGGGTLLCSSIRGTGPTWPHVEEQVVVPPWEDPRHDILNDSEHRRPARPNWATTSPVQATNNSLSIYDTHVWWRCGPYRARNCCVATPSVAAFDPSGPIRERAMEVRACVVAASQHHAFRGRRGGADPCDVLLTLLRPPGEIEPPSLSAAPFDLPFNEEPVAQQHSRRRHGGGLVGLLVCAAAACPAHAWPSLA